jgi:hypothetical protein
MKFLSGFSNDYSESLSPLHVLPRFVDRGMASKIEGSCKYIELAVTYSLEGEVLQLGFWMRCYQLLTIKTGSFTKRMGKRLGAYRVLLGKPEGQSLI